jgi:hypothetical protein
LQDLDHRSRKVTTDIAEPTNDARLGPAEAPTALTPAPRPTAVVFTPRVVIQRAESCIDTGIVTVQPLQPVLAIRVIGLATRFASLVIGSEFGSSARIGLPICSGSGSGSEATLAVDGDVVGCRSE